MCRRKVRWYHRRQLKSSYFVVGGPDLTTDGPDRSPSTCAEVWLRHAFAFFFTAVVPLLRYLSFCNCVPDPDMSINKPGVSLLSARPEPCLCSGSCWWAPSGPLGLPWPPLRSAQVESRCATKLQHLLNGPAWALNVTTGSFGIFIFQAFVKVKRSFTRVPDFFFSFSHTFAVFTARNSFGRLENVKHNYPVLHYVVIRTVL